MTTATVTPPNRPSAPGEWTLEQIRAALSRPLPEALTETKRKGNTDLTYIPWHQAVRILDKYAPGWAWEIRTVHTTQERLFLTGRLTIPTANGLLWREATGTEQLKELFFNKNSQQWEWREIAYGDPSSNAESMALRRAAAKFGLGLYLYDK